MTHMHKIQRNIMRRVYYAYALRIGTHPATISAGLFAVGVYGLSVVVHVASVIENILSVQVGKLPYFIMDAVLNTDVFTLMFLGVIIFSLLSFRISIRPAAFSKNTYQAA